MLHHLSRNARLAGLLGERIDEYRFHVADENRGIVKQVLISLGFPVHDVAGYVDGDPFPIALKQEFGGGTAFTIREYRKQAARATWETRKCRGAAAWWCCRAARARRL